MHGIFSFIGWILVMLALMAVGHDILTFAQTGAYHQANAWLLWYKVDHLSLDIVYTSMQRNLPEPILNGLLRILALPGWLVLAVPGILFTALGHPRHYRLRRRMKNRGNQFPV